MSKLQLVLVSVLLFFLVLASVAVYLFFTNQQFLGVTKTVEMETIPYTERQIIVNSDIPGLKIEIANKDELLKFLNSHSFWLTGKVANYNKVEARLTANRIIITISERVSNPFSIQQDSSGNLVIASALNISENGDVNIDIALGKYILEQDRQNIPDWLKTEFWKTINLATRGKYSQAETPTLSSDTEYQNEVFTIAK